VGGLVSRGGEEILAGAGLGVSITTLGWEDLDIVADLGENISTSLSVKMEG